ncbi:MAG: hypothetical protein EOP87_10085 [Verrucomicrobiaceae bacterium]|nr:MAG: hypothetical protein EOP87_10085 [Verrucomicrobiaceae bacterium]
MRFTRREFMELSAFSGAGSLLGLFPSATAEEALVKPEAVRFRPEIEPLVRFLEETSRERLLGEMGTKIKGGTTCQDVITALFLAGIRNIQPRPVGFNFHAVLVVNSAYKASLNSRDADRWLPVFWALDHFKARQVQDFGQADWTMEPVKEPTVIATDKAASAFEAAMNDWDLEKADGAAAGMARGTGTQRIFDLLCRYGARDYRYIGHKAIYVANGWRRLQTIGWQHAEPVLRSLAYALLAYQGEIPLSREAMADRSGKANLQRLKEIRDSWLSGTRDNAVTRDMLATIRSGTWDDASRKAVELLNRGSGPHALWDGFFLASSELLMRRANIFSLHACTTINALHYSWLHCSDDETRRFMLLQAASFLPYFREDAEAKGGVEIDGLEPWMEKDVGLESIFSDLTKDPQQASRKALAYLQAGGDARAFTDTAQRLVYLKGDDAHDYKFSAAVFEDLQFLPPGTRDRFLAASVFALKGTAAPDSQIVARTRAAL